MSNNTTSTSETPSDQIDHVPLEIKSETQGSATVFRVIGPLGGTFSESQRNELLTAIPSQGEIIIDLMQCSTPTGTGLRRLLLFVRHVRRQGTAVTFRHASDDFKAMVNVTGFDDLLRSQSVASQDILTWPNQQLRTDFYPTHCWKGFHLRLGSPMPLGATVLANGINFAVYSRYATQCTLVLYESDAIEPFVELPFPEEFRIGDVFAMTVYNLDPEAIEYGFRVDGPYNAQQGHRYDKRHVLLDPMAPAISWHDDWGQRNANLTTPRSQLIPMEFDWQGDQPARLPTEDLVIYEMHVRGFTRHESSGVQYPGTYAGIREKIPHLLELGVNCIELLPIFEFDETEVQRTNPQTGEALMNYWGYSTLGFFAPKASYAASGSYHMQAAELKTLIKELHNHGIEVILDVVFNHTCEGNENGPTYSFRGLDNSTYYMLTPDGEYYNFSGCGNTVNCNHPVVREFVVSCLRYWAYEYHIDGFRFDLASILGRAPDGTPLANPPLLESLAQDPVLRSTKLIAEAWDAGGLYQVGQFPAYDRWSEWNGKYRDCVRRFLKSDLGQTRELAQRISGSPDMYYHRGPAASINFITCHDGFSLADVFSYNDKHNLANGEDNRDGSNDNLSWNCGVEGPTDDPEIQALRMRQCKNAIALLMLSQGVPMLLMGDEFGRSKSGNNNTYCQDNVLSWLDWTMLEDNAELFRFCKQMIAFRKSHRVLRHRGFPGTTVDDGSALDISWHGTQAWQPDWSDASRALAFLARLRGSDSDAQTNNDDCVYAAMNSYWEPLRFELPAAPKPSVWHRFAYTGAQSPEDICIPGKEIRCDNQRQITLQARSVAILVAKR